MTDIGVDVLNTELNATNGAIAAQLGDSVNGEKTADDAEWFQHVGFASRPSKAEPGKSACQVLSIERTDRDIVYASRDLRGTSAYGELGEGETALFANGPNGQGTGLLTLKDDGSEATINLAVKQGNSSGGSPVQITVKSDGTITISTGSVTMTINGQSGDVTIDALSVNLGGSGGYTVLVDQPIQVPPTNLGLAAWLAAASTALAGFGVPPLGASILSTKVKAV